MRITILLFTLLVTVFLGCTGAEGPIGPAGMQYDDLWEDFESGGFAQYPWQMGGNNDWQIVADRFKFGVKSASSGTIGNSQSSALTLSVNLPRAGFVSFYCTVSSEASYDWLQWELDGVVLDGISGVPTVGFWFTYSYPVPPGQHTITWRYEKDGTQSSGLDKGWVDGILITNYSVASTRQQEALPPGIVLMSQMVESVRK